MGLIATGEWEGQTKDQKKAPIASLLGRFDHHMVLIHTLWDCDDNWYKWAVLFALL